MVQMGAAEQQSVSKQQLPPAGTQAPLGHVGSQMLAELQMPVQQGGLSVPQGIVSGTQVEGVVVVVVPSPPAPVVVYVVVGLVVVVWLPIPSWPGPPGSLGPGGMSVAGCEPVEQPAALARRTATERGLRMGSTPL